MNKTRIKICYIGGGSRYWAKMILTDLALTPHLEGEFALYDINYDAAKRNETDGGALFDHPDAKTKFRVKAFKNRKAALRGADFVFMSILPGSMQMMANDLDIPAKYGILQTVGDTTGPGGISRALRTLPIYQDYARLIMETCPDAWVINYTNPMTLCTAVLHATEPKIKAFGCCHEVFGTQKKLAEIYSAVTGLSAPHRREIKLDVSGVNHFTFARSASYRGKSVLPQLDTFLAAEEVWKDHSQWARSRKRAGKFFDSQHRVAWDFYKYFGALGAAGDRHLVEFVPWYLSSERNLHRTGVVATPSSFRLGTWKPPGNSPRQTDPKTEQGNHLTHSGEEAVAQLLALLGIRDLDTNLNIPNQGQMPQIEDGPVVETNVQIRRNSITPIVSQSLPAALVGLVKNVVSTQNLTLQASLRRDRNLAFQALLSDPLSNISILEAEQMFDEILQANKELIPHHLLR